MAEASYELSRLMPRHHLILDLSLTGLTNIEIARMAGVTSVTVASVINCPLGQAELARRRASIENSTDSGLSQATVQAKKVLDNATLEAAGTMVELLKSGDETIKYRSAKDILDRAAGMSDQQASVVNVPSSLFQNLILAMNESKEERAKTKVVSSIVVSDSANLATTVN